MKRVSTGLVWVLVCGVFSLSSDCSYALADQVDRAEQLKSAPPPIEQPLVREGVFALRLADALDIGSPADEIEAETLLGNAGIAPQNGWIADYPVTPDIIAELQKAVRNAAAAGKLSMGGEEALKRLDEVCAELGVMVRPANGAKGEAAQPPRPDSYPDQTVINNYYSTTGPPIVTYYEPPPDYYYLYSWVPFPFWWFGFWYPGYFILNDFHRVVHFPGRIGFISNHFRDARGHRVYRVDPVSRFRGRSYTGIGAVRTRGSISTGVPRGGRTIFNSHRYRLSPGGRDVVPQIRKGRGGEGRERR